MEASPGQSTYNEHNIFSIIKLLIDQAEFIGAPTDAIGLVSLSIIVVHTVIIVPLCQLALLLFRWEKVNSNLCDDRSFASLTIR